MKVKGCMTESPAIQELMLAERRKALEKLEKAKSKKAKAEAEKADKE